MSDSDRENLWLPADYKIDVTTARQTEGKHRGKVMVVLSTGGHPQRPGSGRCTVLDVNVFPTKGEALDWAKKMKIERPWETRQ